MSQPIGARSTAKRNATATSPGDHVALVEVVDGPLGADAHGLLGRLLIPRDVVVAAVRVDRQHQAFAASFPARRPRR